MTTDAKLPSSVRVGPFNLEVITTKDINSVMLQKLTAAAPEVKIPEVVSDTTYGFLSLKDQCIYLAEDQKKSIVADTILHEILHAIWAIVGGWAYTEADEERIVSMITGTLLDTLKRNKDLVRFLLDD